MKIGIDISQLAYPHTGVSQMVKNLVERLASVDHENHYVLFYSSLRKPFDHKTLDLKGNRKVKIKEFKIPPTLLSILWNDLHIAPIEWFIGDVDMFISSDWTQPPVQNAKKVTILYDLIVYLYPQETSSKIVTTQKKRLSWVVKEVDKILCISESTKRDAMRILAVAENKLEVIYPGIS